MKKIIEVGTRKVEVLRRGHGEITAVIELGLGTHFYDWKPIIDGLSKEMTVFTYHRAGYGNSTVEEEKRTVKQIAEELNAILKNEGIEEKIILIGHSFGGLCVQHFSQMYPQKIKGIVLVDPNTIRQNEINELPIVEERFPKDKRIENWYRLSQKSKEEIKEETHPKLAPTQMSLSEEEQQEILDFSVQPNLYETMAREDENMDDSIDQIKSLNLSTEAPLKVMVRDKKLMVDALLKMDIEEDEAVKLEDLWQEMVKGQGDLSQKGEVIEVIGAGHNIQRDNPELVIDVVKKLVNELEMNDKFILVDK